MEDTKSPQQPTSLDNESGYEDGVSDVTTNPHTPDLTIPENMDSLIADTSVLTLQTDTDSNNSLNTRSANIFIIIIIIIMILIIYCKAAVSDIICFLGVTES